MYLLLLLLWCHCCIAVGCGVATTAALVHEETGETDVEKTRTRRNYEKSVESKEKLERSHPQGRDGGGAQAGTSERPGRCQQSPLTKKFKYVYGVCELNQEKLNYSTRLRTRVLTER